MGQDNYLTFLGTLPVPGGGHLSQRGPQALPTLQQQSCLLSWADTGCKHCLPELTKRKQAPFSSWMGVLAEEEHRRRAKRREEAQEVAHQSAGDPNMEEREDKE